MVVSTKTVGIWVLTLTYFSLVYITFIIGICKKVRNESRNVKNTYVIETELEGKLKTSFMNMMKYTISYIIAIKGQRAVFLQD